MIKFTVPLCLRDVIVVEFTNFVGIEWGITFTEIKFTVPLCLRVSLSSSSLTLLVLNGGSRLR